ncbi:outer membrane protein assembly factor BamE domain-containing protein [Coxiella-like endosymbiont]|nr:outer membrane protein assembly factor BamE [Coxiella-like endosymbiont]
MTKDQVRTAMDNPALVNIFTDNRMVYIYTLQPVVHRRMQSTCLI